MPNLSAHTYFLQTTEVLVARVGVEKPRTFSRDDRSGKQAPDESHTLETDVQIVFPQPFG